MSQNEEGDGGHDDELRSRPAPLQQERDLDEAYRGEQERDLDEAYRGDKNSNEWETSSRSKGHSANAGFREKESGAKRYTKGALEVKKYDWDEWKAFTKSQQSELMNARKDGGTTYSKKELDELKKSIVPSSKTDWSKKSIHVVNGIPHGICEHCDPILNLSHTTGQHAHWMACQALGTTFKPGRNSMLAHARRQYKFTPPSEKAKPPPVNTDLVGFWDQHYIA